MNQAALASPHAGVISEGTFRSQDLVPAYMNVLGHYGRAPEIEVVPLSAREDDYHGWWDSEACWHLIEDLHNRLDELAADLGLVFGSHGGDGACIGFWEG